MARALRIALVFIVLALLAAAPASAEPGFEYGEIIRFGGFDRSAYDFGQYGGPLTPGKFLDPTGFAVDPRDNTVYVVDRTSSAGANPTSWRIQQFSPQGEVEGTTTFTLPNEAVPHGVSKTSAIAGLAVDHRDGRLYALVVGSPPSSSPFRTFTVAQELLAWLTSPNARDELEAAPGLEPDPLHTTGALVSREEQLASGATPLYEPQGIAVDPLETNLDDPIAIEASDVAPEVGAGSPVPGDTIVQQVATQPQGGKATGDLLASWSGASVAAQLGGHWGPHGISTGPDGTLTVLLESGGGTATDVYTVGLKADFSEAAVLSDPGDVPPNADFDQSPMYMDEPPFFSVAGTGVSDLNGAGSQVIHLSAAPGSTAGLYAAVIFTNRPGDDSQVGPTIPPGPEYWRPGEPSEEFEANIGVRLLRPEAGGAIGNLQGRTIVNTLGNRNRAQGGPCNIGAPEAALATGADGRLWILDRGPRADRREATGQGREVIELAPGEGRLCPQPEGTFTMTAKPEQETLTKSGEEQLEIPAGTQVTFSTGSINRRGGKPFAYEWDLNGSTTGGPADDGFAQVYEMQPPHYYYPPSSITYMYTRPGKYEVRVRMRGDYGVYTPPQAATVIVTKALAQPEPRFTATESGGQQIIANASGSTPGIGKIVNYHWNWGDGGEEDEGPQTPVVTHTYAQPGSYRVTLTVTNSSYQSATSAAQTVTVVAPPPAVQAAVVSLTGPLYDIPPPFAPYPIPSPSPDRAPTRLAPHVRFAGGVLSVALSCPAAKQRCAGTVSIETAAAIVATKAGKSTIAATKSGKKSKHRAGRLLLGHAAFSISSGHSKTLKLRLSAKGIALLKSKRRLKVLVLVSAHDPLGDAGTTSLTLTLNAPAAHGRRSSLSLKHN